MKAKNKWKYFRVLPPPLQQVAETELFFEFYQISPICPAGKKIMLIMGTQPAARQTA
jgi:hypothetical protein